MQGVTVVDHPLVQHKLTLMRDKSRSTKSFRQLAQRDRHAHVLRGDARPAARHVEIETPMARMKAPEHRRQEARVRADPARRRDLRRRHARAGAVGARRPYRALPRSRDAGGGRILLQGADRYRRPPGDRHLADDRDRQLRRRGGRPAQGARRQGHPLRLPARRAEGDRAVARHPSRRARSGRRRSTSGSTITATSSRASAMPATALSEQNEGLRTRFHPSGTPGLRSNGHTRSAA